MDGVQAMQEWSAEPPATLVRVAAPLTSAVRPGERNGHSPDRCRVHLSQRRCNRPRPEPTACVLPGRSCRRGVAKTISPAASSERATVWRYFSASNTSPVQNKSQRNEDHVVTNEVEIPSHCMKTSAALLAEEPTDPRTPAFRRPRLALQSFLLTGDALPIFLLDTGRYVGR